MSKVAAGYQLGTRTGPGERKIWNQMSHWHHSETEDSHVVKDGLYSRLFDLEIDTIKE